MIFFKKLFRKKIPLEQKDFVNALNCELKLIYKDKKKSLIRKKKPIFTYSKTQKTQLQKIVDKLFSHLEDAEFDSQKTNDLLRTGKSFKNALVESKKYKAKIHYIIFEKAKVSIYYLQYSVHLKSKHIQSIAFQKFVLEELNIKVNQLFLIYINSSYIFQGSLEEKDLFSIIEVTKKVEFFYSKTKEKADYFYCLLNKTIIFSKKNLKSCSSLRYCNYINECEPHLENTDIFTLTNCSDKIENLLKEKITKVNKIKDLKDFPEKTKIQIQCIQEKKIYVNQEKIKQFLNSIQYPTYFLDFECFTSIVPIYKNSQPIQHFPFQYSLHCKENQEIKLEYFSYLSKNLGKDPREEILEKLSCIIQKPCSIVCYNANFEKKCLKNASSIFKQYENWFKNIEPYFIDLAKPFLSFDYYHFKQNGSTSLKTILPLMTGISYSDLEINRGVDAASLFLDTLLINTTTENKEKVFQNLEKYSYLDSYGLFKILEALKEIISN